MIRQIIPFLAAFALILGINAQSNLPTKDGSITISLETGQTATQWPMSTMQKSAGSDVADELLNWGKTASRPTRLSVLYNLGSFSGGLGLLHESNSVNLYEPTAGYSAATHLRFSTLAAFVHGEYRFVHFGNAHLGLSLRYGRYLGSEIESTTAKLSSFYEVGLPFHYSFSKNLGFTVQPYYGFRNIQNSNPEFEQRNSAGNYGATLGLQLKL